MNIGDYVFDDELAEILQKVGQSSGFNLAIFDEDDNLLACYPENTVNGESFVDCELHVNEEKAGNLKGFFQDPESKEKLEILLDFLRDFLEKRLSSELELESLSMEIANNYQEINLMFENNALFAELLDVDELIGVTMKQTMKVAGSEKAVLMFLDKGKENLIIQQVEGVESDQILDIGIQIQGSVFEEIFETGNYIIVEDISAAEDVQEKCKGKFALDQFATESWMIVPLKIKEEIIGILSVGDRVEGGSFTSIQAKMLTALAVQSAASVEKARLYKNIEKETKIRSTLQRYLSPTIVDDLVKHNRELKLGGERLECSILFTDICSFTTISEQRSPEDVVMMLNEYFSAMAEIIFRHQGTLDKFIGDAIMAVFGAPLVSFDCHMNSVACGVAMLEKLREIQEKWRSEGKEFFQMRVGINTGPVVAGNIGSSERMDYTVIGDTVNLASRLESNAQPGTILISGYTYEKVKDFVNADGLDPIKVKGKAEPIQIYRVNGIDHKKFEEIKSTRKFVRVDVSINTTFINIEEQEKYPGVVLNVSRGGVLLGTKDQLVIGDFVILSFSLSETISIQEIEGKVVYTKKTESQDKGPFFHLGVEFSRVSENNSRAVNTFLDL